MSTLSRFLLGLEKDEALGSDLRWEFAGLPQGAWLILAVLVLGAALLLILSLYRRERGLHALARYTLSLLRVASLLIVVLVLLNPRIITELRTRRPGQTPVLLDVSRSMNQHDHYSDREFEDIEAATGLDREDRPSRMEIVQAVARRHGIIEKLAERNEVSLHGIGSRLERLAGLDEPRALFPAEEESRLGDGLRDLLREIGREPAAGIVLISDGRYNAGIHPIDLVRDPVRWRSIPLHTVGVGLVEEARNFAISELSAPDTVEVGYPVEIEGSVQLRGIRGTVNILLHRVARKGGGSILIEQRTLESMGPRVETRLKFIDTVPEKGGYRYRLEIERHPEETTARDNRREVVVLAVEEKHRVLLVSGTSPPIYKFARRFFYRDDGIQVSAWQNDADPDCIQNANIVIRKLPTSAEELISYDVVVLLDPDPDTLSEGFGEALRTFVTEQGGGLAYVAGESFTPRIARDARLRRFLALLPVSLNSSAPLLGARQDYAEPWRPLLTGNGESHPVCRLQNDPDENATLLSVLAPFYFVHPTTRLRPSGIDLLRDPQGNIVAAIHQAGLGEVVYLGTDDFYRWRFAARGHHERFWSNLIRHLRAGKRRAGQARVTVETDRDHYGQGEQVRIMVQLSGSREEIDRSRVSVLVEAATAAPGDADGKRLRVSLYPDASAGPGMIHGVAQERFAGLFRATRSGHFRVLIDNEEKTSFEVTPISSEWQDPTPDFHLLEELAGATGGTFRTVADAAALAEIIPVGSVSEVVGRRATAVWDSAALMCLFAALVSLEWILRKIWHLN